MKKLFIGIVGIIIIGIIIYFVFRSPKNTLAPSTAIDKTITDITPINSATTTTVASTTVALPKEYTITYTSKGFDPKEVTINVGDTVKFINKSTKSMWVGSDDHPTHTKYSGTTLKQHCPDTSGTSFDQCAKENEYSFTFNKIGNWNYHNHSQENMTGKIIVE